MPMSPRLLRPRATAALVAVDADARAYINAVRIADNGQYMEAGVQRAIDAFVIGCKADGIWTAIKASCILMGARTLSGALTPLVGSAPANNGPFVSGDYNRETGLVGNGTTKSLGSGRNENSDPTNNNHMAVYASTVGTQAMIGSTANPANHTISAAATRNRQGTASLFTASDGLIGTSRAASANYQRRTGGSTATVSEASGSSGSGEIIVFNAPSGVQAFGNHRIAFYSIGESLDLALLDSRVTTLYNAIGAAI